MEWNIVHRTICNSQMLASIALNGLLIPSERKIKVPKKIKDLNRKLKNSPINYELITSINKFYDNLKPKHLPERSNSIYGAINLEEKLDETDLLFEDIVTYIKINFKKFAYVSDQNLGGLIFNLHQSEINLLTEKKLPLDLLKSTEKYALEYWSRVISLEEFEKNYRFHPLERLSNNSWIKREESTNKKLPKYFLYPEIIFPESIPRKYIDIIHSNIIN
ncbi:hypothetical protein HOK68_01925 [Candidatus Woesearchaeota archaeon]|jgi:hypothetical protein|nr:hypothetical protein [Candidatus Woesearchaeota archaeon]MBT4387600.1 hypothetical protein [Candidatus Woesearchaeota archaeon]MBT4596038.1 hypothetical protein [Candidatus Woesearchaeota archaeon]MBT5740746.1 hypothetical protein [Candidatus Woesearchaeota archaeon]MBT6505518.1 hypothetical protein [Candidatus Woesearchaeota archaeon]